MPVLTKNQRPGPTVFRDKARDILVEWSGKGDPQGSDHQYIPEELLEHPQFLKALRQGIVTVEDDSPEVQQAIAKSNQKFASREAEAAASVAETIDREVDKDMVFDAEGNLLVKGELPEELKTQYVLVHTDEVDADGEPVTKWVKVAVDTNPLPSQQQ